jgi:hypothetical protein
MRARCALAFDMKLAKFRSRPGGWLEKSDPPVICFVAAGQDWPPRPTKAEGAAGLLNLDEALLQAFKLGTDLHFQCVL